MAYKIKITVQVVNEDGDVMNNRGFASHLNRDGRLEQFIELEDEHYTVESAETDYKAVADSIKDMIE